MTENETMAWAAGFLDGEGCLMIQRQAHRNGGSIQYCAKIQASQVRRAPLDFLVLVLGGKVTPVMHPAFGLEYHWYIHGRNAAMAAKRLLPFLVLKRRQAEILIEHQATVNQGGRTTPETRVAREALYLEAKSLNEKRKRLDAERLSDPAPTPSGEGDAIVRSHGNSNRESRREIDGRLAN